MYLGTYGGVLCNDMEGYFRHILHGYPLPHQDLENCPITYHSGAPNAAYE